MIEVHTIQPHTEPDDGSGPQFVQGSGVESWCCAGEDDVDSASDGQDVLATRPRPRDQLDIAEDLGLDIEILEPSSEDRHPRSSDVHVSSLGEQTFAEQPAR